MLHHHFNPPVHHHDFDIHDPNYQQMLQNSRHYRGQLHRYLEDAKGFWLSNTQNPRKRRVLRRPAMSRSNRLKTISFEVVNWLNTVYSNYTDATHYNSVVIQAEVIHDDAQQVLRRFRDWVAENRSMIREWDGILDVTSRELYETLQDWKQHWRRGRSVRRSM